jgi:hypothetical protein
MDTLIHLLTIDWIATLVNYAWVWPIFEMLHFIGMALLIGTVGLLDLRILGFAKGIPISSLSRLVPLGIAGFVMNAFTGFMFIAGNPVGGPGAYVLNLALQIKMALVLIAAVNLLVFQFSGLARATDALSPDGSAPAAAKAIAASSLVLWFGVIFFGRLIMYNDTLLWALGM